MIGYIKGSVEEIRRDCVVLDRDGIGFRIFVPTGLLQGSLHISDEIKLFTYLSVKEDSLSLYGFLRREELDTFKLLIGVNGVGPKAALGILSNITVEELRFAVLSDDTKKLAKAPGIGKKTAAKLVLELKDSFNIEDILPDDTDSGSAEVPAADGTAAAEAAQALIALGYGRAEAMKAVRAAASETGSSDTEVLLKAALKHIF